MKNEVQLERLKKVLRRSQGSISNIKCFSLPRIDITPLLRSKR